MSAAIIALLAFVGGVAAVAVKGWIDYLVEVRRERRTLRAIARLAEEELRQAVAYLSIVASDDQFGWWERKPPPLQHPVWDEHRYVLASEAGAWEWSFLKRAYSSMDALRDKYERTTYTDPVGPPLDQDERRYVEGEKLVIERAIIELKGTELRPLPFERWGRVIHPRREFRRWRAARKRKKEEATPSHS